GVVGARVGDRRRRTDPVAAVHREQDLAGALDDGSALGPRRAGARAATAAMRRLGGFPGGEDLAVDLLHEVARLGVADPLGGPVVDDPLVLGLGSGLRVAG